MSPVVTRAMTSRDPKKVKVVNPISLKRNISKTVGERRLVETDYQ